MHRRHSPQTRRALLATLGSSIVAGCTRTAFGQSSEPRNRGSDCEESKSIWPMGRHDARQTGNSNRQLDLAEITEASRINVGGPVSAAPTITDEYVYFPTSGGSVVFTERESPQDYGYTELSDRIRTPVAAGCNRVFVRTDDRLYCFGVSDGLTEPLWRVDYPSGGVSPVLLYEDQTVFGTTANGVFAVDARDGRESWRREFSKGSVCSGIAVNGRDLFAVTSGEGHAFLFGIDKSDGTVHWSREMGTAVSASPVAGTESIFIGTEDGRVIAVEREQGRTDWSTGVGSGIRTDLALDSRTDQVFAIDTSTNTLNTLSASTGDTIWTTTSNSHRVAPTITENSVLVAGGGGSLRALRKQDGERITDWKTTVSTNVSVGRNRIYVGRENELRILK